MNVCRGLILALILLANSVAQEEPFPPRATDPNFEITLFAEQPQIVTPIGIAADRRGRLFVIESHTHEVKPGYEGPSSDRVKVFEEDRAGKVRFKIFAEGFRAAMNLAFGPRQQLYLVQRDKVLLLPDIDRDDRAEEPVEILTLVTEEKFSHNGLDGIAFGPDGWMYVGLGENLGRSYTLRGTDGSSYSGGSEGGNVFRCKPDGSRLELYATGFWNPFALEFNREGDLFAVDNDPDGRPPCRLLHVTEGADFGYKFRYGRSGLHPFVAWNGELPGTLPMTAATGEAPSGILNCQTAGWPRTFWGSFLVTGWGDNTLELYPLAYRGASYSSSRKIFVQGDKSFRPVGVTAVPNGDVFVTDWADKAYPVHGKGRIWRLRYKGEKPLRVAEYRAVRPEKERLLKITASQSATDYPRLREVLRHQDPYLRSAAVYALQRPVFRSQLLSDLQHPEGEIRLGVLLALRRAGADLLDEVVRNWLQDPVEEIRRMALIWVGENGWHQFREDCDLALSSGGVSPELFATYLAAVQLLEALQQKEKPGSVWDQGFTGTQLIERMLKDPRPSAELKILGLAMAPDGTNSLSVELLSTLLKHPNPDLRAEVIFSLWRSTEPKAIPALEKVALDRTQPATVRAHACAALADVAPGVQATLLKLLQDPDPEVVREAVRALAGVRDEAEVSAELKRMATHNNPRVQEQLGNLFGTDQRSEITEEQWLSTTQDGGESASGKRLFFHTSVGCIQCHRLQGKGGGLGPDLTLIARSMDREKLAEAILHPSRNIAPQFVAHEIETEDGLSYSGLVTHRGEDYLMITTANRQTHRIPVQEIVRERVSTVSFMPEGLEETMSLEDFRDLLAFLNSLR